MEAKFKVQFKVNSHDTDRSGNLRPSVALRYFHEAANLQFEASHPTLDELRYEEHKAFLLSRASLSMLRPLHAFEEIEVLTWSGGGKAASFYRCGEILAGGEVVAKLVSVWALMDLEKGRLCRVKDTDLGILPLEEYPLEIPTSFRIPEEAHLAAVGERMIRNSDIDINMHMNNTNYPDMLCDYIPGIENKKVLSFDITYHKEARLSEHLTVYHGAHDGVQYLRTLRSDGLVNAEARFVTEDLF
ncbi:MAG: hypothetical protein IKM34_08530 [Clostridia bacterium]|nr:hypothetical protein [Clostridia bacterium]